MQREGKCSHKEKQEIADSFNFDDFTGRELLTDVKRSGLYSIEKIDARVLEILEIKEEEINYLLVHNRSRLQNSSFELSTN